jgi:GPH family glycoside/pentoside/hexuronide:cation symporter
MKEKPKKRLASPWRYSLGMLGYTIPSYMYISYGTYFYSDKLGLSMSLIALGNIIFTIWDAVNDPMSGYLSDRTRTRIGRRKPWLLVASPLFAIFMTFFFRPGSTLGNGAALAVYFTVFLMLTETMNTIVFTNYHSLFPELFKTDLERTTANGIRQALQLVGLISGVSLTPMLADLIGYQNLSLILGVVGMALFLYSVLGCKEDPEYQNTPVPGMLQSFSAVFKNKNFWTVSFSNFFYQATNALILVAIPFFIKYTLGLADSQATYLTGTVFVIAIPAVLIWSTLARKFGALFLWRVALITLCLSFIPMLFVQNLIQAIIAGAFIGIGLAGITATLDIINAYIIDEDAAISGQRREGIYQSAISFIIRFSGLGKSLVFFLISLWFGFESSANPGTNPAFASRVMFSVFPLIFMILACIISFFVKFNHPNKEAN